MFSDMHYAHTCESSVVFTESAPKAPYYNTIVNDFQTQSVNSSPEFLLMVCNSL